MNVGSVVSARTWKRALSTTVERLAITDRTPAGMRASRRSPSSSTCLRAAVGSDGKASSSTSVMFLESAPAEATIPWSASSPTRATSRGAIPKTTAVTSTRMASPIAGTRSSRRRRSATRTDDTLRFPRAQDAADADARQLPLRQPERHDEQGDRREVDRNDRLPRDDDDRRGNGRQAGLGERRERQDQPGQDEPQDRARRQPDHEEEDALDRQPERELSGRQAERPEQGELADPLARRDRRADEEADPSEQHRGERAEAEDPDQPERHRIGREAREELCAADDRGRA